MKLRLFIGSDSSRIEIAIDDRWLHGMRGDVGKMPICKIRLLTNQMSLAINDVLRFEVEL